MNSLDGSTILLSPFQLQRKEKVHFNLFRFLIDGPTDESDSLPTREPWVGHREDTDSMQLISVFKTGTEEPFVQSWGATEIAPSVSSPCEARAMIVTYLRDTYLL